MSQALDHDSASTVAGCRCEACVGDDLPVNPFVALRVAFGMLLGEDDFRTLMGNPRGKQMLHSAWLHGRGVVWGYDVQASGDYKVHVGPGLAIDGWGRELFREHCDPCLDVRALIEPTESDEECGRRTVHAYVLAEFDSCLSAPVPTLADPCDVTRKHDDYSRVLERTRIRLVDGPVPARQHPFCRVRALLGLTTEPLPDEVERARERVLDAPAAERASALLHECNRLAALDAIERRPVEDSDHHLTLMPVAEEDSGVVLATVTISVRDRDGCPFIEQLTVEPTTRDVLLPTATIQQLTCGLAPALDAASGHGDGGGPQVDAGEARLIEETSRWWVWLPVTAPVVRGSLHHNFRVESFSPTAGDAWHSEEIQSVSSTEDGMAIVVDLASAPRYSTLRVWIRGTGPSPVMGVAPPEPLAGVVGEPPTTFRHGRDAAVVLISGRGQS